MLISVDFAFCLYNSDKKQLEVYFVFFSRGKQKGSPLRAQPIIKY